jgi:hypothetical protein
MEMDGTTLEYSSVLRVRLKPETAKQLEVEARRRGTKVSALMRQFIEAGLDRSGRLNPVAGGSDGSLTILDTTRPKEIPVTSEHKLLQQFDELSADERSILQTSLRPTRRHVARQTKVEQTFLDP